LQTRRFFSDIKSSEAAEINKIGIVDYLRKGKQLPSSELIKAFQDAIKLFCEDPNSVRNDEASFRDKPAIVFFNRQTGQVAIFNRETKSFITAYKLSRANVIRYLQDGTLGRLNNNKEE
jgi:hypothetical protein